MALGSRPGVDITSRTQAHPIDKSQIGRYARPGFHCRPSSVSANNARDLRQYRGNPHMQRETSNLNINGNIQATDTNELNC